MRLFYTVEQGKYIDGKNNKMNTRTVKTMIFFSPFCRLDFLCNELFNAIDMLLVVTKTERLDGFV